MANTERHTERATEVREIISRMDDDRLWDSIQAKDLDPKIVDHVENLLKNGLTAAEVARSLGLTKNGKQFKKIQAYFRQGFRADAELYLYQQTHKFYKQIESARQILDDAFENGTPHVIEKKDGTHEVIRVKGATPELGSFLDCYSKAISTPVKLWKEYGAIGERKDVGMGGVTIQVVNNIPMPTIEEIQKHKDELVAKSKAIEVKVEKP